MHKCSSVYSERGVPLPVLTCHDEEDVTRSSNPALKHRRDFRGPNDRLVVGPRQRRQPG
jgi:hypothetical protein